MKIRIEVCLAVIVALALAVVLFLYARNRGEYPEAEQSRTALEVQNMINDLAYIGEPVAYFQANGRITEFVPLFQKVRERLEFPPANGDSEDPVLLLTSMLPKGRYGFTFELPIGFSADEAPLLWWPLPDDPVRPPEGVWWITWLGERRSGSREMLRAKLKLLKEAGLKIGELTLPKPVIFPPSR